MILIIGGAFQGKLEYALALSGCGRGEFLDGGTCDMAAVYSAKGIFHFHEYLKRRLRCGMDCGSLAEELYEKNPQLVIVTNELGYGVVPVDRFDREWRETAGRVCSALAGYAHRVDRVVCGIGMVLKNDNSSDTSR